MMKTTWKPGSTFSYGASENSDYKTSSESRDRETTPDTMPEGAQNQGEEEDSERDDVPYSQSGVVEKRRRMEELAARKRRR